MYAASTGFVGGLVAAQYAFSTPYERFLERKSLQSVFRPLVGRAKNAFAQRTGFVDAAERRAFMVMFKEERVIAKIVYRATKVAKGALVVGALLTVADVVYNTLKGGPRQGFYALLEDVTLGAAPTPLGFWKR